MCFAQDVMATPFGPGPDYLVMASLTLFYAVQLGRGILSARPRLAACAVPMRDMCK
ncbi:MAG TPA: hypothetical protein VF552_02145 [Allosphingosinicella sp.]|jgi:hypothetical protein